MTIRFLQPWDVYQVGQIATLAGGVETTLVSAGIATTQIDTNPDGDNQLARKVVSTPLTTRSAAAADDGNILVNSGASNYTLTIPSGLPQDFGVALLQSSTGTCTVAAGGGVTLIGSTLATTSAGDLLAVIWVADNTYVVKAS